MSTDYVPIDDVKAYYRFKYGVETFIREGSHLTGKSVDGDTVFCCQVYYINDEEVCEDWAVSGPVSYNYDLSPQEQIMGFWD